MKVTKEIVYSALKTIIDPELGVDIVGLGLIYDVWGSGFGPSTRSASSVQASSGSSRFALRDSKFVVEIDMTLTTPGCPLAPFFQEQVPAVVAEFCELDVEKVQVNFTFDPPWIPDMMSEEVKAELGFD